jgi:hypothetical protein
MLNQNPNLFEIIADLELTIEDTKGKDAAYIFSLLEKYVNKNNSTNDLALEQVGSKYYIRNLHIKPTFNYCTSDADIKTAVVDTNHGSWQYTSASGYDFLIKEYDIFISDITTFMTLKIRKEVLSTEGKKIINENIPSAYRFNLYEVSADGSQKLVNIGGPILVPSDGTPIVRSVPEGKQYKFEEIEGSIVIEGYTFKETKYSINVLNNEQKETDVTNIYTYDDVSTTSIDVSKRWLDAGRQPIDSPQPVKVQLIKDGVAVPDKIVEVLEDAVEFTDLPIFNPDGSRIVYTVKEIDVPPGYITNISNIINGKVTITNRKQTIETSTTSLEVVKNWSPNVPQDFVGEISIVLTRKVGNGRNYTDVPFSSGLQPRQVLPNKDSGWTYTYLDLPTKTNDGENILYGVREESIVGYKTSYRVVNDREIVITNTRIEDPPPPPPDRDRPKPQDPEPEVPNPLSPPETIVNEPSIPNEPQVIIEPSKQPEPPEETIVETPIEDPEPDEEIEPVEEDEYDYSDDPNDSDEPDESNDPPNTSDDPDDFDDYEDDDDDYYTDDDTPDTGDLTNTLLWSILSLSSLLCLLLIFKKGYKQSTK